MSQTPELTDGVIRQYKVEDISILCNCPTCKQPESDRIDISANEAYCYCFPCDMEWIVQAEIWAFMTRIEA